MVQFRVCQEKSIEETSLTFARSIEQAKQVEYDLLSEFGRLLKEGALSVETIDNFLIIAVAADRMAVLFSKLRLNALT